MGKKNNALCAFLAKPEIFADFMNGNLYGGKWVYSPEDFVPLETGYYERGKDRRRDVVKLLCHNRQYAILAVENQDEINPIMPLRCMEYDVTEYLKQVRRLKREHREKNDLQPGAEYLSGVSLTDRLKPMVTVVFYHGKGEWETCRELHDMLEFKGNEEIRPYVANYRMNLVIMQELKEETFRTSLRELVGVMKRSEDAGELRAYIKENKERFDRMDDGAYEAIGALTGKEDWMEYGKKPEGGHSMWKALEGFIEEGRIEGRKEGRQEGRQEGWKEGRQEGSQTKLIDLVCRKLRKGKDAIEIADALEEELPVVERICKAARELGTDCDVQKIYQKIYGMEDGRLPSA